MHRGARDKSPRSDQSKSSKKTPTLEAGIVMCALFGSSEQHVKREGKLILDKAISQIIEKLI